MTQLIDGPIKREPDLITDHAFTPRVRYLDGVLQARSWDLCGHPTGWPDSEDSSRICGLAESAHAATTLPHPG